MRQQEPRAILALDKSALRLLVTVVDQDIASGQHVGNAPPLLLAEMCRIVKEVPVNLDEALDATEH